MSCRPIGSSPPAAASSLSLKHGFFAISPVGGTLTGLGQVKWSRHTGLLWEQIEPGFDGKYTWTELDNLVDIGVAYGYSLVFVLKSGHPEGIVDDACYTAAKDYSGSEFNENISCPLKSTSESIWRNMIRAVIRRYGFGSRSEYAGLPDWFEIAIQIENESGDLEFWNPAILRDGKEAAAGYIRMLRQAYMAKQMESWTGDIILCGLTLADRIARCTYNNDISGCTSNFDTRNRTFSYEIFAYPQYFDAFDIHNFNYNLFYPTNIYEGKAWVDWVCRQHGYSSSDKKFFCLESTGGILISIGARGAKHAFGTHFPFIADFQNISYLEDPSYLSEGENSGPFDAYFLGTYTGLAQKIFAVKATEASLSISPDAYWYTDDYQQDGLNGGLTTWSGPVTMSIDIPQLIGDGISVLWGSRNDHQGTFGISAVAHPAGEPGTVDFDVLKYYYQNLDFAELPPPDGISADSKYREWFEAEDSRDWLKVHTLIRSMGASRLIHTQFHDFFPGYGWKNIWWRWHGIIRYTSGDLDNPAFIKKPLWHAYQQAEQKLWNAIAINEHLIDGTTNTKCYEYVFATGNPVFVCWTQATGVPAGSIYGPLQTITLMTENIAFANAFGWSSAKVTEVIKELDGSNDPITVTTTISGATTYALTYTPVFVEKA